MKWAYLERQSTTTIMALEPFEFDNPSTKSIEISSQVSSGIGRGCKSPGGWIDLYFCL
ncbi:hypothetical protein RchiOBHm_Chr4g0431301 [Rosa chinensis]|uniref:Uncharacterized protein n=1 Tax=Rosa chinensis TaxID=74649 RepID=A0A2P6R0U6_ROSCH|nr:hypothetical protein RchiOBHm_Chr4g0431301 [Rosa chinensis]